MTDERLGKTTRPVEVGQVDATTPNAARTWNYLVGGRDNFDADRKAARQLIAASPVVAEAAPATRAFHRRVIRYLAEAGIRQFLDVGMGLPTTSNTHQVAQALAPRSRVVYVDNDPVVLSHARARLTSTAEGAISYLEADARQPGAIVEQAGATLDFGQPVAVILIGILNFITGAGRADQVVRALAGTMAPGSYLAIMHPASDLDPSLQAAAAHWNQVAATPVTLRSREEVSAWARGLDLVDPGVVPVTQWRAAEPDTGAVMPLYGFLARKS